MMSDDEVQKFQATKREIEERTLKSTEDSLKLLGETENSGLATAGELLRQGGQLKKIHGQVDEITNLLTESQKNINEIKSVFGSLKRSLFGKKKDKTNVEPIQKTTDAKESKPKSSLQEKLESHNGAPQSGTATCQKSAATQPQGTDFDSKFNANMDGMSKSLSMLKSLATGLGDELENQNELIKKITYKTEEADITIGEQNRQMRKMI